MKSLEFVADTFAAAVSQISLIGWLIVAALVFMFATVGNGGVRCGQLMQRYVCFIAVDASGSTGL
ncbi:MAG: hypothetical protein J0H44_13580 [Alphaproteobacteria bacterium]|nr:hypothetical protein [Alphaproteobacteria bacterium]